MSEKSLKQFYLLWSTQTLSRLGSAMTSFALMLWLYEKTGSALRTTLLSVCSYAPYVLMSIFAGALSDRWNKKRTMLWCDLFAAACSVLTLLLIRMQALQAWHLYLLNAVSGLMNTVQSPASEVAVTLVTPKERYQKVSSLRSASGSMVTIVTPVVATAFYGFGGIGLVITADLLTFAIAFLALLLWIRIPEEASVSGEEQNILGSARQGLIFLGENRMVLYLILFLSGVNLVASAFDAALPAFILPHGNGGDKVLGMVVSVAGISMLAGNILTAVLPVPKDRIRMIVYTMLFSLTADNFLMSLTDRPVFWCIAQVLGYVPVTLMNVNLDVVVRSSIPAEMQGRVYACRNSLQFFTIPLGQLWGGWMVDEVFCPLIAEQNGNGVLVRLFGADKSGGAALMIFVLGILGLGICLYFHRILKPYRFEE